MKQEEFQFRILDKMPNATEAIPGALLMNMEQDISIPAVFDLLYNMDIQIYDTVASNHTNPYKESCIKMRADKENAETIRVSENVVHGEFFIGNPETSVISMEMKA